MDNPLAAGPELSSKIVARDQGLYATASMEEVALIMAFNFVFTDGEFKEEHSLRFGQQPGGTILPGDAHSWLVELFPASTWSCNI